MADPAQESGQATPAQQEATPLFTGTDAQGKERLFTDANDAQKSWQSSQDFIKTLQTENGNKDAQIAQLQAQLDQSTKLDEALSQLQGQQQMQQQQTTDTPTQMDVEALTAELMKKAQEAAASSVTNMKAQEMQQANRNASMQAAQALYGSEFESKLREKGQQMGLDDNAIVQMADSNPALFKKTFDLEPKQGQSLSPDGVLNTSGFNNVKAPELKNLSKQWGATARVGAVEQNMAAVQKMLNESGGNLDAVAQALGVKIRNYVQ